MHRLARAPGHALLHGDPCPGNDPHTIDGTRFIDFEQVSLGSGPVELAWKWGTATARQCLVHRLGAVGGMTATTTV
ncbi:hypothetical protein GA0115261_107136 [Streptomyces sp. OspMP-M43]|nr:hypothetical protein GA0115261_107136 [Streptomyces sp. OspMP-M43]